MSSISNVSSSQAPYVPPAAAKATPKPATPQAPAPVATQPKDNDNGKLDVKA